VNHEVVAELVEEITTRVGLMVNATLDKRQYPTHIKGMTVDPDFREVWIVGIASGGTYTI
jgi:hypothetical protein